MRITDTQPALVAYAGRSDRNRNTAAATDAAELQDDFASGSSGALTLPDLLRLTSAENPSRDTFLTALSQSLRDGLHTTDPSRVAKSMLRSGFDVQRAAE